MQLDLIYTNHMILQRDEPNIITGWCDGEDITALFDNESYQAQVSDHRFVITLSAHPVGGPYSMIVKGHNDITLSDIYFGDVYMLAGQSNMEFKVRQLYDAHTCIENSHFNNIRFFKTPQYEYQRDGIDYPRFEKPEWTKLSVKNVAEFSAIGYYLAEKLDQLNIPIGFVECNRGGTSASCWIDAELLAKHPNLHKVYVEDYYRDIKNQSEEAEDQARKAYQKAFDDYQKKVADYQAAYPERSVSQMKEEIGHTPWPGPKGHKDFCRPSGLYEVMFKKVNHYSYKAVIWYQGEEDAHYGEYYQELLKVLIHNWRRDFDQDIPFYIVQLPRYDDDKTPKWPLVREAQMKAAQQEKDCYLIVSIDTGEHRNIHPGDKHILGLRIANSILMHTYHLIEQADAPKLMDVSKEAHQIILTFDQRLIDINDTKGFTLDGEDIVPVVNDQQVIIPKVGHVLTYAYANDPQISLTNDYYIPISPFKILL